MENNEIENAAREDVKELLSELVVDPLKKALLKKDEIQNELYSTSIDSIKNSLSSIKGRVQAQTERLCEKLGELPTSGDLNQFHLALKKSSSKIDDIKEETRQALNSIHGSISMIEQIISSKNSLPEKYIQDLSIIPNVLNDILHNINSVDEHLSQFEISNKDVYEQFTLQLGQYCDKLTQALIQIINLENQSISEFISYKESWSARAEHIEDDISGISSSLENFKTYFKDITNCQKIFRNQNRILIFIISVLTVVNIFETVWLLITVIP